MTEFSRVIHTIDAHSAGEPLRIITSGLPPIPGKTILEKRRAMRERHDHLRKLLMLEPRGHSGMYGCIVTSPVTRDGDFGVLFMHNEGFSTMCGHGIIAVTKVAVELGMVEVEPGALERLVRIDAPAGRITSRARLEEGAVVEVSFENVPSFVYAKDVTVSVDGIGDIEADIAFGGAFYVYVDAEKLGVKVEPEQIDRLVALGEELKHKVMVAMKVVHPLEPGLHGIYGTIICEPAVKTPAGVETKNVCIFADAQIDRSPTGTGTSGRLAQLYARGEIKEGERLINRSVIDTIFTGMIKSLTRVGGLEGVITEVGGAAHIMGFHQFVLEPGDPLPEGLRITGG
jgi:proline racemase